MNKNTKTALTIGLVFVLVLGGVYVVRQFTLLRNICVRSVQVDFASSLSGVISLISGNQSLANASLPLDLIISNDSSADLTLEESQFDLYVEGQKIAEVDSNFEQIIAKGTDSTYNVDFQFVVTGNEILQIAGSQLISIIPGVPDPIFTIKGNIKAKASIFETIDIEYRSDFTLQEMAAGNASESSGSAC